MIDDTLLALDYKKMSILDSDPSEWIDAFFRQSLAFIQARNNADYNPDPLIRYLKERNRLIMNQAGEFQNWKNIINTGMPFRASVKLKSLLPNFSRIFKEFVDSSKMVSDHIKALSQIEILMNSLPNYKFQCSYPKDSYKARNLWLSGASFFNMRNELGQNKSNYFCSQYFGFTVPWVLNAVAKSFSSINMNKESEFYEDLAVITELGLPNTLAAKVFLSGITSRVSAIEISTYLDDSLASEDLDIIKGYIIKNKKEIEKLCSDDSKKWLNIFTYLKGNNEPDISNFPLFKISGLSATKLYFRQKGESLFLASDDYSEFTKIREDKKHLFKDIAQNTNYYLDRISNTDSWRVIES